MIWIISSDVKYYRDITSLKKTFSLDEIIALPKKKDILKGIKSNDKKIGFISNLPPKEEYRSFVVIKELFSDDILTTQEKLYGVTEEQALQNLFGLQVSKPKITLETDLIGQNQLHLFYKEIKNNIKLKRATSPIFELGVPGVGKTHSASCLAGSLGCSLIQLNLTMFVEKGQGVNLLHQFFKYLTSKKPRCVILFDEFENMVDNKSIMGALLSILGALNEEGQGGYHLTEHQILIATANNISDIVLKKPQFFRLGRWSHKFFFNYPTKDNAILTMLYFAKKYNVIHNQEIIEDIYIEYTGIHKNNFVEPRSVYSQVELKFLIQSFENMDLITLKDTKKTYTKLLQHNIDKIIPSQQSTKQGITKLLSDAGTNEFTNVDSK